MKTISISLWGDDKRYSIGAIKNAELSKKIYPDWTFRVYHDNSIKNIYLEELKQLGTDLILVENSSLSGHFWRFFSAFNSDTSDITIFRDADSRLSKREKTCVDLWISSDKKYSIIRDHIRHYDFPILAGMWGIKGSFSEEQRQNIFNYANNYMYTIDQIYLKNHIWYEAENDSFIVGIKESEEFNMTRYTIGNDFVGQGYDEFDNPIYPRD